MHDTCSGRQFCGLSDDLLRPLRGLRRHHAFRTVSRIARIQFRASMVEWPQKGIRNGCNFLWPQQERPGIALVADHLPAWRALSRNACRSDAEDYDAAGPSSKEPGGALRGGGGPLNSRPGIGEDSHAACGDAPCPTGSMAKTSRTARRIWLWGVKRLYFYAAKTGARAITANSMPGTRESGRILRSGLACRGPSKRRV